MKSKSVHPLRFAYFFIILYTLSPWSNVSGDSKIHKFQDAEYNRFICTKLGGITEVDIPNSGRADCSGDKFVAEIEFSDLWQEGINQVQRYSKGSGKQGILILVIENELERAHYEAASKYIKSNHLENQIRLESFDSSEIRIAKSDRPCIKRSRKKICHAINTGNYGSTTNFTPFESMADCLKSGGRRAGNVSIARVEQSLKQNNCGL